VTTSCNVDHRDGNGDPISCSDATIPDPRPLTAEPVRRWWLLWSLYGLPRCSQNVYPFDDDVDACHRLIWPWQRRHVRNGSPVHDVCVSAALPDDDGWQERGNPGDESDG